MEAPVLDKVLDGLPCAGKPLDFVEYDDAVAWNKSLPIRRTEIHEERVEIVQVFLKVALDLSGSCGEIDDKIGGIFIFGKFFGDVALAYAPCAVQHDCRLAVARSLPFKKGFVYLAFHRSFPRLAV